MSSPAHVGSAVTKLGIGPHLNSVIFPFFWALSMACLSSCKCQTLLLWCTCTHTHISTYTRGEAHRCPMLLWLCAVFRAAGAISVSLLLPYAGTLESSVTHSHVEVAVSPCGCYCPSGSGILSTPSCLEAQSPSRGCLGHGFLLPASVS